MITIPDIHGRKFWKEAIKGHETEEIIFLGDYVDPYSSFEDVNICEGLTTLREVIRFKKQHPDNVILLLGNHDLSYVSPFMAKCRHDYSNHNTIRNLILDNLSLFDIAKGKAIGTMTFLFSHAGILPTWLRSNKSVIGDITPGQEAEKLNMLFHTGYLYSALGDISIYRGGYHNAGSCVWADIHEHLDFSDNTISGIYQIFGHTLQINERPVITDHFACLDCRHAFFLDENGQITQI